MAQTIQVKRSTATTAPAELANGELAYSHVGTRWQTVYIRKAWGCWLGTLMLSAVSITLIGLRQLTPILTSKVTCSCL